MKLKIYQKIEDRMMGKITISILLGMIIVLFSFLFVFSIIRLNLILFIFSVIIFCFIFVLSLHLAGYIYDEYNINTISCDRYEVIEDD